MEIKRAEVEESRKSFIRKRKSIILVLFAIVLIFAGTAVSLGCYEISFMEVCSIIFRGIMDGTLAEESVWHLRLPRVVIAVLAGFGLAVAGTMVQGTLRNPLASPFTLGIASGASFGASLALYLSEGAIISRYLVIASSFFFALVPTFLIITMTRYRKATPETMILTGISMLYLFGAFQGLVQFISSPTTVQAAMIWGVGTLERASWEQAVPMAIVVMCFVPLLIWKAWPVNILGAGDEVAESLSVRTERTRISVLVISTLLTAGIVCFTGTIGFIGLVAPHLCRMVMGGDNRFLIPAAGFLGAALLLGADTIGRTVIAPESLPVGALVSLIAGPIFICMLARKKEGYW